MIHNYSQWIKESEKVEPTNDDLADLTPAQMEASPEPTETSPVEPTDPGSEDQPEDIDQFQEVDQARRDAIQAFKDKQKEFLDMPAETRKNPTNDEDKAKVQSIKDELISLNTAMKNAWSEWSKLNSKMLGISDDEETSVEP